MGTRNLSTWAAPTSLSSSLVAWSSFIAAHSNSGDSNSAIAAFNDMRRRMVEGNFVTFLGLLAGVRDSSQLICLHGFALKIGFERDLMVRNSIINVYFKCGSPNYARILFDKMPDRDLVSWNTLISGYSRLGLVQETLSLFTHMRALSRLDPDRQTFSSLVSCVAASADHLHAHHHHHHRRRRRCRRHGLCFLGRSIHAQIIVSGISMDELVETSLMNMYMKQRNVWDGLRVCDLSAKKDSVFMASLISGLVQNNRADEALRLLPRSLTLGPEFLSSATIASLFAVCSQLCTLKIGASLHGYVLRRNIPTDLPAHNSLLAMYAKCGCLRQARLLFSSMKEKDLVSWNSMISGFSQHGDIHMAMATARKMMEARLVPDAITLLLLLKGSSSVGSLRHGRSLHGFIMRNIQSVAVSTSLVDMYSKCGELVLARRCFNLVGIEERDLVLWSSMIAGYGIHGQGEAAVELFSSALSAGIRPNKVVFLAVLMACSHAGLVDDGLRIFMLMGEELREMEHVACIVDLLGRKGMLREAADVASLRRHSPEVLGILLDSCRIHGDKALAEEVAGEIMALEPANAASYVQMVHGFAAAGRWDGVVETWKKMKVMGLKKTPGWSSVEVGGGAAVASTTFFVDQLSHHCHRESILLLQSLYRGMRINNEYEDYDELLLELC